MSEQSTGKQVMGVSMGIFLGLLLFLCVLPVGGFVGCMACGVIGAAAGGGDASNGLPTPQVAAAEPQVTVSAQELIAAFEGNEVVAENTYSNRRVRVTGTVTGIRTDISGDAIVELGTSSFLGLSAELANRDAAATLSQGQEVSLNCLCGRAVMRIPHLDDCRP